MTVETGNDAPAGGAMTIASAAEGSCVAISAAIAGDDKDATIASSEAPKTLIE
jgi:hypothetical protein